MRWMARMALLVAPLIAVVAAAAPAGAQTIPPTGVGSATVVTPQPNQQFIGPGLVAPPPIGLPNPSVMPPGTIGLPPGANRLPPGGIVLPPAGELPARISAV